MRRKKRTRLIFETPKHIIEMKPLAILAILWFAWTLYYFTLSYEHNFVNNTFIKDWLMIIGCYIAGAILSFSANIKDKI